MNVPFEINAPDPEVVQETFDNPNQEEENKLSTDEDVLILEDEQEDSRALKKKKRNKEVGRKAKTSFQNVFSGKIMSSPFVQKQKRLIVLLFGIMLLFVYSSYRGNIQQVKLKKLSREVSDEQYIMMELSQQYSDLTRATNVSNTLKKHKSRVQEASTPPIRIK